MTERSPIKVVIAKWPVKKRLLQINIGIPQRITCERDHDMIEEIADAVCSVVSAEDLQLSKSDIVFAAKKWHAIFDIMVAWKMNHDLLMENEDDLLVGLDFYKTQTNYLVNTMKEFIQECHELAFDGVGQVSKVDACYAVAPLLVMLNKLEVLDIENKLLEFI